MRLRDITKHLTDYNGSVRDIEINNRKYRVSPEFEKTSPLAFVGQAFGAGDEYNKIIAESMEDARDYYQWEIPIFTQTEIGNLLKPKTLDVYSFGETYEEGETSEMISKIDSYGILEQISNEMDELGVPKESVLFFAHPGHVYRIQDQGRIFGMNGGVFLPEKVVWPKNDPQKWVRNEKSWESREKYGRMFLWMNGKIKREL